MYSYDLLCRAQVSFFSWSQDVPGEKPVSIGEHCIAYDCMVMWGHGIFEVLAGYVGKPEPRHTRHTTPRCFRCLKWKNVLVPPVTRLMDGFFALPPAMVQSLHLKVANHMKQPQLALVYPTYPFSPSKWQTQQSSQAHASRSCMACDRCT